MFPEQQRKILALENEEAVLALLHADLSPDLNPDLMTAQKIFGKLLMEPRAVPDLIMTLRFYAFAHAMAGAEDGRKLVNDKSLTAVERINGLKVWNESVRGMSQMIDKINSLARKLGCIKVVPKGKVKKPTVARILRPAPSLAPTERISVGLEPPATQ